MPVVRCHVHPKARAYVTALLAGTAYRPVPATSGDASGDPAALLLTAYQPSAHERRPSCAGIRQLAQWRRDGERAPALVCAFRSEERLVREPANAVLRETGTTFLRLPCRRDALLDALDAARPLSASEREGVAQRACTAWGQFAGYADRLIANERGADLALLRAFARRRFGAWLDAPLARAEACQARGEHGAMKRLLREAQARAPEAVVYRTFGQLAHGRAADLSNKGLGPLRATLTSMQRGLVGDEPLDRLLASASWRDFKSALHRATQTLTSLERSDASLPESLRAPVRAFREQARPLLRWADAGAIRERPAAVVRVIDALQDATRDVLRQRADARRRMT